MATLPEGVKHSPEREPFFTATTYQKVKAEVEELVRCGTAKDRLEALDQIMDAVEFVTEEVEVGKE